MASFFSLGPGSALIFAVLIPGFALYGFRVGRRSARNGRRPRR